MNNLNFKLGFKFLGYLGIFFLLLPVIIVIVLSFSAEKYLHFPPEAWSVHWYRNLLTDSKWHSAFSKSLIIGFSSACFSVILGLSSAYGLYKYKGRHKLLLVLLFLLPLFFPTIILGVGMLFTFSKIGLFDSFTGIIMSHTLITIPYSLLVISSAISTSNMRLEQVAKSFGASSIYTFLNVTLPQIKKSLINAWLLSFLVSFDEPIISLFLTGSKTTTLPRQLFDGIRYDLDPTATVVSSIMILLSILVTLITIRNYKFE